jgi:flavin-dependent dehydrogenase
VKALVVGGGPAGLSAAMTLAPRCERVVIIEARDRDKLRHAGEHLPPRGVSELAVLGLSQLLADERHDASPGVRSAWGKDSFTDKEYFMSAPGRALNLCRAAFDESLARRAESLGATLVFGVRLMRLERGPCGHTAIIDGPTGRENIAADVVVDATGRRAAATRQLGATRRRFDGMIGLLGRIERCAPIDEAGRVHVESMRDGWWYGVQLSTGTLVATFMTEASTARRRPGGARALWGERLGGSTLLAPIAATGHWRGTLEAFDAATQFLDYEMLNDLIAVGDAAAAYDPLSSWGITKGISDGHAAAEALMREWKGDRGAIAGHREHQRLAFEEHRAKQRQFYEAETRWSNSAFWRARRAATEEFAVQSI